jgi:hypothetical protein
MFRFVGLLVLISADDYSIDDKSIEATTYASSSICTSSSNCSLAQGAVWNKTARSIDISTYEFVPSTEAAGLPGGNLCDPLGSSVLIYVME